MVKILPDNGQRSQVGVRLGIRFRRQHTKCADGEPRRLMTIFNTLGEEEVPTPDTTGGGSPIESGGTSGKGGDNYVQRAL